MNILNNLQLATGEHMEHDGKSIYEIVENYENLAMAQIAGPLALFPYLRYLPGDLFGYYKMKKSVEILTSGIKKQIEEHKNNIERDHDDELDYIYAYLQHMKKVDPLLGFPGNHWL